MKRGAVIIGVNKAGNLPVLNAAVTGAKDFAQWASQQSIEIKLLTDENDQPVTVNDILDAVKFFVQQKTLSQLIVFFSGHGILKGPDYELWLLSGAPGNPNEAVNVLGSIWQARYSGIPHIVVISDACRSRPDTHQLNSISNGGVIFPNESPRAPGAEVDVFFATLPGDPALEAPLDKATAEYRGIFTECLLKGLEGKVPEVIEALSDHDITRQAVTSWKLKPYLYEEVPEVASNIDIKLRQTPEVRVESHAPKFLSEVLTPNIISTRGVISRAHKNRLDDFVENLKKTKYFPIAHHLPQPTVLHDFESLVEKSEFKSAMERLLHAKGRESFETRTGFTVFGAEVARAAVAWGNCDIFTEADAYHIRVHESTEESRAKSVLLKFADSRGTALAVLPGFIGTVVVEDARIVNVNYTPSRHTLEYSEYALVADVIEERRAFVAAAARHGSFRLENERASGYADYLRFFKSIDPTLGLYAAYAYAQCGAFEEIESVYQYMSASPAPIPFDVALLARKLSNLPNPTTINFQTNSRIAPFCPMLTQGWALIEPYLELFPQVVHQVRHHLIPALWTTFSPEGIDILWSAIENGEIS